MRHFCCDLASTSHNKSICTVRTSLPANTARGQASSMHRQRALERRKGYVHTQVHTTRAQFRLAQRGCDARFDCPAAGESAPHPQRYRLARWGMASLGWSALGGSIGCCMRVGLGLLLAKRKVPLLHHLPLATLLCNLVAALMLGLLVSHGVPSRWDGGGALLSAIPGGLSTASALAHESGTLTRQRHLVTLCIYLLLTNVGGVALAYAGLAAA